MIYLILLLAAGLLLAAVKSRPHKTPTRGRYRQAKPLDRRQINERWQQIEQSASAGGLGMKDAISEADKLLDHVLRQGGYRGETMAERLKSAQSRFSNADAVWRAHKLRNALVHEVQFDLVQGQARTAINDFRQGLRDLGAL